MPRYRREDWLDKALAELSVHGPEALKLEAICAAIGLTRGSFYHHFEDHAAFLTAAAQHWKARQTTELLANQTPAEMSEADHAALEDRVVGLDFKLELGMRELSRRHPEIAEIVAETDALRIQFIAETYRARFNLDAEDADAVAGLEYATFVGSIAVEPNITSDAMQARAVLLDQITQAFFGPRATD